MEFVKKWKWIIFVILIYGFAAFLVLNGINYETRKRKSFLKKSFKNGELIKDKCEQLEVRENGSYRKFNE